MPGGGTLTAVEGAVGLTTLTEGTGFTVGAAKDAPQLEQKVASSLFDAAHCGQDLTIIFPPVPSVYLIELLSDHYTLKPFHNIIC